MLDSLRKRINQRLYAGDHARMVAKGKIPDPQASLMRINKLGFQPKTIFDVGAYQGDFTSMCVNIWPRAKVHAFEALPQKIEQLKYRFKNQDVVVNHSLVGNENKNDVQFYADETSSSVLESYELNPKQRISVNMITLDSYADQQHLPPPDLLKIDTQGYEFPILKGFEKNLESVQALLLELNFLEIYYHVTLAHEVIHLLSGHGFVIYDICEVHRRPLDQAVVNMDFLFLKKDSVLRKDKRWDVRR